MADDLDDGLDELERELLRRVRLAKLPSEEPISEWIVDRAVPLKLRAWDHAFTMCDGLVEYHCLPDGQVEVKDYRDPRSMRYQRYDPERPGQPYMHPSREDDTLPVV